MATQIAMVSILFRSMFDAKYYDWSYYTLAAIAPALAAIARRELRSISDGQQATPGPAKAPAEALANLHRPNVYGAEVLGVSSDERDSLQQPASKAEGGRRLHFLSERVESAADRVRAGI